MASVNKVILVGNLGRDPEVRYANNGSAVATLSLATSRKWTDKDGQPHDETEWHRVVVFGRTAEACSQYLSKGSSAYVEGRIKTDKWTGKDGKQRHSTTIVAETVQFLGGKQTQRSDKQSSKAQAEYDDSQYDDRSPPISDDDIPF